jgi:hypothetical protein
MVIIDGETNTRTKADRHHGKRTDTVFADTDHSSLFLTSVRISHGSLKNEI